MRFTDRKIRRALNKEQVVEKQGQQQQQQGQQQQDNPQWTGS
jgi:hypothetical protein